MHFVSSLLSAKTPEEDTVFVAWLHPGNARRWHWWDPTKNPRADGAEESDPNTTRYARSKRRPVLEILDIVSLHLLSSCCMFNFPPWSRRNHDTVVRCKVVRPAKIAIKNDAVRRRIKSWIFVWPLNLLLHLVAPVTNDLAITDDRIGFLVRRSKPTPKIL